MKESQVHSRLSGRAIKPLRMTAQDCKDYADLAAIGINLPERDLRDMRAALDSADLQNTITSASITTPVQFLQAWLPGLVTVITAARKIDELVGIDTVGSWEDEEVVQGVLEQTGQAVLYGDTTNVPLSSWNLNFERRSIVRFENGFGVGRLEEARSAKIRVDTAARKRNAAANSLEIQRNRIGFYGYNNGNNRTFGYLNDPDLPGYITVPDNGSGSTEWADKTFLQITADIRLGIATLRAQAMGNIDPKAADLTMALPISAEDYLSVTSDYGNSVNDWIKENYPKLRVISVPELEKANGGVNALYLYAEKVADGSDDDGNVWSQPVPAKFQPLGVEQKAKGYLEDFSNATAGIMCKRPYAVVRLTGI